MRSGIDSSFFIILASLLALSLNACMKPSGEAKKDVPDRLADKTDDKTDDKPGDKPADKPADKPNNLPAIPPLKISVVMNSPNDSFFEEHITPTLQNSCIVSGCHASSEVIDLRSFPFQAEGSYAMDDIVADLGPNPDPGEVQKRLVQVLISSMQTGYMPPPEQDPVSDRDRGFFEQWLADDLPVTSPPFSGKFHIKGMRGKESVCETTFAMKTNVLDGMIEREPCRTAQRIEFTVADSADHAVTSGHMSFDEFVRLKIWKLVIDEHAPFM